MNRRDFMKSTVVAGATAAFARPVEAAVAPSDRITVGFIGCGARAHEHLDDVKAMAGVEVVAVADAYAGRAERARARTGGRAAIVGDYREILANPAVDAVFVVTPDHWHKAMVVEALAAKKDVYVEKPMSYSIEDGLAMVAAAKKSDRIVQVGSQGVSGPDMIKARLRLYRDCGVTTLRAGLPAERDLDTLAQLVDLVREVNEEPSVR